MFHFLNILISRSVKYWCLLRHYKKFFSALNEVHQFLFQQRSSVVKLKVALPHITTK